MSADDGFGRSGERFEAMTAWLESGEGGRLDHGALEEQLDERGRDLLCQMLQDHLDLRTVREARSEDVVGADEVTARRRVEPGHTPTLRTVFGAVVTERFAYRRSGRPNLYPGDAALNLPVRRHSHGLRRLAAIEASRGSYDGAVEAIQRARRGRMGPHQS